MPRNSVVNRWLRVFGFVRNGCSPWAGARTWLADHDYESLEQLRGSMNYETCPDPSAYLRANYMMLLQSWSPEE